MHLFWLKINFKKNKSKYSNSFFGLWFKKLSYFSILVWNWKMKNEKFSKYVLFLSQKTNYTFSTAIKLCFVFLFFFFFLRVLENKKRMKALKIQSKSLLSMKIVVYYLKFFFHIDVKTKSRYRILNFVFQFSKNTKWQLGTRIHLHCTAGRWNILSLYIIYILIQFWVWLLWFLFYFIFKSSSLW